MNKYRLTFYHEKNYVKVEVSTWATSESDARAKASFALANNPNLLHPSIDIIESERP